MKLLTAKDASVSIKLSDDTTMPVNQTIEPSMTTRTMPLPYNADATNDDENETMPLMFSCKQRRAAKLNYRQSKGMNMTEHNNNCTYDNMAESSQIILPREAIRVVKDQKSSHMSPPTTTEAH